jgi:hypothetical protein
LWAAVLELTKLEEFPFRDDIVRGVRNSVSDIIPLVAVDGALTGNPFAAISLSRNITLKTTQAVGYLVTGDIDNSISTADKTLETLGGYRTSKSFVELLVEFNK